MTNEIEERARRLFRAANRLGYYREAPGVPDLEVAAAMWRLHFRCLRLLRLADQGRLFWRDRAVTIDADGKRLLRRAAFVAWADAHELEPVFIRKDRRR